MAIRLSAAKALRVMIDGAASASAPAPAILKTSRRVVFMAISSLPDWSNLSGMAVSGPSPLTPPRMAEAILYQPHVLAARLAIMAQAQPFVTRRPASGAIDLAPRRLRRQS